ncbi:hypothetical protein, partial [Escherichia coli]|uniref:hypothetical protein n=1 Tax=Escherichia coli TaxID=562 RepID=UPI001AA12353
RISEGLKYSDSTLILVMDLVRVQSKARRELKEMFLERISEFVLFRKYVRDCWRKTHPTPGVEKS